MISGSKAGKNETGQRRVECSSVPCRLRFPMMIVLEIKDKRITFNRIFYQVLYTSRKLPKSLIKIFLIFKINKIN
jgi:hypothetical protein